MRPRLLVGHARTPGRAFECRVLLQSVKLALRTGFLVRPALCPALGNFAGSNSNANVRGAENGSGFDSEEKAVERHSQTTQEKQRREVIRHQRQDKDGKLDRHAVAAREVMNHTREKHVEQSPPDLTATVGTCATRQLHLRNRLAAKGALLQTRRHVLAAKCAALRVRGLFSNSVHAADRILPSQARFAVLESSRDMMSKCKARYENGSKRLDMVSAARLACGCSTPLQRIPTTSLDRFEAHIEYAYLFANRQAHGQSSHSLDSCYKIVEAPKTTLI